MDYFSWDEHRKAQRDLIFDRPDRPNRPINHKKFKDFRWLDDGRLRTMLDDQN
jgi:hypothetical protein